MKVNFCEDKAAICTVENEAGFRTGQTNLAHYTHDLAVIALVNVALVSNKRGNRPTGQK